MKPNEKAEVFFRFIKSLEAALEEEAEEMGEESETSPVEQRQRAKKGPKVRTVRMELGEDAQHAPRGGPDLCNAPPGVQISAITHLTHHVAYDGLNRDEIGELRNRVEPHWEAMADFLNERGLTIQEQFVLFHGIFEGLLEGFKSLSKIQGLLEREPDPPADAKLRNDPGALGFRRPWQA